MWHECVFNLEDVARFSVEDGYHLLASICQSRKTQVKSMTAAKRRRQTMQDGELRPMIIVVSEDCGNVKKVATDLVSYSKRLSSHMRDPSVCPHFEFMDGRCSTWQKIREYLDLGSSGDHGKNRLKYSEPREFVKMFVECSVVPVIQCHHNVLVHVNAFIKALARKFEGTSGFELCVVMDEGDKSLLKPVVVARGNKNQDAAAPSKKRRRARMENEDALSMTGNDEDDAVSTLKTHAELMSIIALPQRKSLLVVSATHIATLHWLDTEARQMFGEDPKPKAYIADPAKIEQNEYSRGDQLHLMPSSEESREEYAWMGKTFQSALKDFKRDAADPSKRGLLLMAATTPYMTACHSSSDPQDCNMMNAAHSVMWGPEGTVAFMFMGEGILATTKAMQEAVGLGPGYLFSRGGGEVGGDGDGDEDEYEDGDEDEDETPTYTSMEDFLADTISNTHKIRERDAAKRAFVNVDKFHPEFLTELLRCESYAAVRALIGEARSMAYAEVSKFRPQVVLDKDADRTTLRSFMQMLDDLDGGALKVPVMAFGYKLFIRSISIRSAARTITHKILRLAEGKTSADVHQAIFRCGGHQADGIRVANGFDKVSVYMPSEDFNIGREYHPLQRCLLEPHMNGGGQSVTNWPTRCKNYAFFQKEFEAIVNGSRRHTVADGKTKKTRVFDVDRVFFEDETDARKCKKLKDIIRREGAGAVAGLPEGGLEHLNTAKDLLKAVPVLVELNESEKAELRAQFHEESSSKRQFKTFNHVCKKTLNMCKRIVLEKLVRPRHLLVMEPVLCAPTEQTVCKLKESYAAGKEVLPQQARGTSYNVKEYTEVCSVHVNVQDWTVYVVRAKMKRAVEAMSKEAGGDKFFVDLTEEVYKEVLDVLAGGDFEDDPDTFIDMALAKMSELGDAVPLKRYVERWGIRSFEIEGEDAREVREDGSIGVVFVPGSGRISLEWVSKKKFVSQHVINRIIDEEFLQGQEFRKKDVNDALRFPRWGFEFHQIQHNRAVRKLSQSIVLDNDGDIVYSENLKKNTQITKMGIGMWMKL